MKWTTARALQVLGLLPAEAQSVRSIRAAFAQRAKEIHPDSRVTADGDVVNMPTFSAIKDARDYLLQNALDAERACKACGGKGKVPTGYLGWRQCGACAGTGDKR